MKLAIVIRRATTADADAILKWLASVIAAYRSQYTPAAYTNTVLDAETIRDRMAAVSLFAAAV